MSDRTQAAPWRADQSVPEGDEQAHGLAGAAEIRALLVSARAIAIVGLSAESIRASFFVADYLKKNGYRIFGVNPRYAGQTILGRPVYAKLDQIPEQVQIVNVFRRPADAPGVADEAIAAGVGALWLQIGVLSDEAVRRARAAGLTVVMDRCLKVEHGRHLGTMRFYGVSTGIISSRRDQ